MGASISNFGDMDVKTEYQSERKGRSQLLFGRGGSDWHQKVVGTPWFTVSCSTAVHQEKTTHDTEILQSKTACPEP